jgi:hypothetical protein
MRDGRLGSRTCIHWQEKPISATPGPAFGPAGRPFTAVPIKPRRARPRTSPTDPWARAKGRPTASRNPPGAAARVYPAAATASTAAPAPESPRRATRRRGAAASCSVLERVQHLTQGQMVVTYVIMESIARNRVSITISLSALKKGQSCDRKNIATVGCWHSCVTNLQRYILDRSLARPGPP